MPGLRRGDHRGDVVAEQERIVIFPVENEIKLMLRVAGRDPFQVLKREPPDPLQLVGDQEPGVYRDFQVNWALDGYLLVVSGIAP